jgi:hypothetical protein
VKEGLILTRVAVILHERLGNWVRQLRPRLHDQPVRWFETRSRTDLADVLTGLACPVVLIDLGRFPAAGLMDLELVVQRASDARILVLDHERHEGAVGLARELGATHVVSGFVPPPVVATLLTRWIGLAQRQITRDGWSRTSFPGSPTSRWDWLDAYLGDGHRLDSVPPRDRPRPSSSSSGHDGPPPEIAVAP